VTTRLSKRAAARRFHLSRATIDRAIASGELIAYRRPGARTVDLFEVDVNAWLRRHRVQSRPSAEERFDQLGIGQGRRRGPPG
jgi:hypothetical protein